MNTTLATRDRLVRTVEAEIVALAAQIEAMRETVRRLKVADTEAQILDASNYLFDAMARKS
jgi:hypothetical protein